MVRKIVGMLSALAMVVLVGGVLVTSNVERVQASGTNQIEVMSVGTDAVSNTIRSEQVAGAITFVLVALGGALIMSGHAGAGVFGFFLIILGGGVLMSGKEVIEGIGLTAASL